MMADPRKAFVTGSALFVFIIAIAWAISGERIDGHWLSQLWLALFFGLFMAGYSARRFSSVFHSWISRGAIVVISIIAALLAYTSGAELILVVTDYPVVFLVIMAAAFVALYHVILGASHLVVLMYLSHFVHKRG